MLAQWNDVHLSFPDKNVLDGVSLPVHRGDKIALVGDNGAGKSSLFRILLGDLDPDKGERSIADGVRVGYLKQTLIDLEPAGLLDPKEGNVSPPLSCIDAALESFAAVRALEQTIDSLTAALERASSSDETAQLLHHLGEVQEQFERADGYTYRARVESTLSGIGLAARTWERPVETLSSGQKARLGLARLLLGEYDLLLLDEPTNHLDVDTRQWLEQELAQLGTAYVVASHDRRFLDAVATKTALLDRGRLTLYAGNYSAFRDQVALQRSAAWSAYEKRAKEVRKLEKRAREYRNWAGAKEKEKRGAGDKGYVGHKAAKLMKRALVTQRRLETTIKEMKTEKPFEEDRIAIEFHAAKGRRLLSAQNVTAGHDPGTPLTRGITCEIAAGDRLALLGPNGCGKTTLLRTLLGEIPPLGGEMRLSPSARVGYFDQENRNMSPGSTALGAVWETGKAKGQTVVRTVMGRMRIRQESVHKEVKLLSAGERAKVLLARLILGDYNLLVLDEPTNHLDIETQDTLLNALSDFPGGIVFVSHDRHFVETLATSKLDLGVTA